GRVRGALRRGDVGAEFRDRGLLAGRLTRPCRRGWRAGRASRDEVEGRARHTGLGEGAGGVVAVSTRFDSITTLLALLSVIVGDRRAATRGEDLTSNWPAGPAAAVPNLRRGRVAPERRPWLSPAPFRRCSMI